MASLSQLNLESLSLRDPSAPSKELSSMPRSTSPSQLTRTLSSLSGRPPERREPFLELLALKSRTWSEELLKVSNSRWSSHLHISPFRRVSLRMVPQLKSNISSEKRESEESTLFQELRCPERTRRRVNYFSYYELCMLFNTAWTDIFGSWKMA